MDILGVGEDYDLAHRSSLRIEGRKLATPRNEMTWRHAGHMRLLGCSANAHRIKQSPWNVCSPSRTATLAPSWMTEAHPLQR
eukprot:7105513-Lingulodinium_polyedra.AAC.1